MLHDAHVQARARLRYTGQSCCTPAAERAPHLEQVQRVRATSRSARGDAAEVPARDPLLRHILRVNIRRKVK